MDLKKTIKHPRTVEEATNRLLVILADAEKQKIKAMAKDDLVLLHFSLGRYIRNAFGLYVDNATLLNGNHADDISMGIIEKLWKKLQELKPD